MNFVLVSGVPSAGKTSFANWVEQADDRFVHIPQDCYVLPVPSGTVDLNRDDENSGRVEYCAECHRGAGDEQDHLFFVPEEHRIKFLNLPK